jgi:choice-of-anchor B domain-containing protein
MRNKLPLCAFLLFTTVVLGQNALNIELVGQINRGDTRYSGSWVYEAPDGTEYALIGAKTGTAAYPISDLAGIEEAGFVPGPESNWREITVIGHHAYVVTEGSPGGMQVIDLSFLPDSLHLVTTFETTFNRGHIIQKDIFEEAPFVYVAGTSSTQGVHIVDVTNPDTPVEVGVYDPPYYIHDIHVRGNIMFAAAFYETRMDIVDISDRSHPVLMNQIVYDGDNTHSASTTPDGKYLLIADESDGYPARVFNIEDLQEPVEVARFTSNPQSLVHNPYMLGDFCFISHNTEGLRVYDFVDPELPVEVGFYDTYFGTSGGFNGLWSACPYTASGKIIGGNRHNGLYVWTFNNTYAARIYGVVKDSLTGEPLPQAIIDIEELQKTLNVSLQGNFRHGMLAGSYTLDAQLAGYQPKTLELDLQEGDSVWVEIELGPELPNAASETSGSSQLSIAPNPFNTAFSVLTTGDSAAYLLELYNLYGKKVETRRFESGAPFVFQRGDLPGGVYLLKALDEAGNLLGVSRIVAR